MKQKRSEMKKRKNKNLKAFALSQIFSLILEIFAWAFVLGGAGIVNKEIVATKEKDVYTFENGGKLYKYQNDTK